jgi:hypothetical protein
MAVRIGGLALFFVYLLAEPCHAALPVKHRDSPATKDVRISGALGDDCRRLLSDGAGWL